jgi:hypothetical protein
VLSGHVAEWIPAVDGQHPAAPDCVAVALALRPTESAKVDLRLTIGSLPVSDGVLEHLPIVDVALLAEARSIATGIWRLGDAHWLEIDAADNQEAMPCS